MPIVHDGLVLYLNARCVEGNIWKDLSGMENHATIFGGVTRGNAQTRPIPNQFDFGASQDFLDCKIVRRWGNPAVSNSYGTVLGGNWNMSMHYADNDEWMECADSDGIENNRVFRSYNHTNKWKGFTDSVNHYYTAGKWYRYSVYARAVTGLGVRAATCYMPYDGTGPYTKYKSLPGSVLADGEWHNMNNVFQVPADATDLSSNGWYLYTSEGNGILEYSGLTVEEFDTDPTGLPLPDIRMDRLLFSGTNQYAQVSHKPCFNVNELTVEMAILTPQVMTEGSSIYRLLFSKPGDYSLYGYSSGANQVTHLHALTKAGNTQPAISTPLEPGTIHTVGITIDSTGKITHFVDGEPFGVVQGSPMTADAIQDILIGDSATSTGWNGGVLVCRFYNRALSTAEMQQNHAVGTELGLGAPRIILVGVDKTKISDEVGMDKAYATIKFDKPVKEYTVRSMGTAPTSGTLVQTDSSLVSKLKTITIADAKLKSVRDTRLIDSLTLPGRNTSNVTLWRDLSGNGLDAVLNGFAFDANSGWVGSGTEADPFGLKFTGTGNYCRIKNNPLLQITGDLTIELLCMPTNFAKGRQNIIDKSYGGEYTYTQETSRTFAFYHGAAGSNTSPYTADSSPAMVQGTKYISTMRKFSSQALVQFTHNGVHAGTQSDSYPITVASVNDLRLGVGYTGVYWEGVLYGIRMYNVVLTDAEVNKNHAQGFTGLDYTRRGLVLDLHAARAIGGRETVIEVDDSELYQEGSNRVNIYGRDLQGRWTPYEP